MTEENIQSSDEEVLMVIHKHWASFLHDIFYISLPALVAFVLLFLISDLPPIGVDSGMRVIAALLFPLSVLAVIIMGTLLWTKYYLDMVVVTDRRLFFISQVGLKGREVLGWNIADVRRANARQRNFLETFFDFGTLEILTADELIPARFDGIPDPESVCAVILKQDDRLAQLNETARKQVELLKFLSREIKGHLTKSKAAFATIVEGDYGPVVSTLPGLTNAALAESQKGVESVMSILDKADIESGDTYVEAKPFNLSEAVRRLADEFKPAAAAKRISLVSSAPETCIVSGDREKIERHVIRNLLDNAIRYTRAGQIEVMLEKRNDMARISISDTGVGINRSDMSNLFTEGGHGAHSREVNPESTGYGLFAAKQIVNKQGGRIWARSQGAGFGSTFFVEFPLMVP